MFADTLPDVNTALDGPNHPLCDGFMTLCKVADSDDETKPWKFMGIASDSSQDVDGDEILKKALDLTYAKSRGFVNWDHGRAPSDQIGFLTKAELIDKDQVTKLEKQFGTPVSPTSTVLVEGELYKYVPKAAEVFDIMKSTPTGQPGLGLSLDGVMARDVQDGDIVKAFVRGIAVTPVPAQPRTLMRLKKSLQSWQGVDKLAITPELSRTIANDVVDLLRKSTSDSTRQSGMSDDEAILFLLRKRPKWPYWLAERIVQYAKRKGK